MYDEIVQKIQFYKLSQIRYIAIKKIKIEFEK